MGFLYRLTFLSCVSKTDRIKSERTKVVKSVIRHILPRRTIRFVIVVAKMIKGGRA